MNHTTAVCIMPYANMMQANIPCMAVHNDRIPVTRGRCCLPLMAVISIGNQWGITSEYFPLNTGKPVVAVCFLSPPLIKVWQYPRHTRNPGNRDVV